MEIRAKRSIRFQAESTGADYAIDGVTVEVGDLGRDLEGFPRRRPFFDPDRDSSWFLAAAFALLARFASAARAAALSPSSGMSSPWSVGGSLVRKTALDPGP